MKQRQMMIRAYRHDVACYLATLAKKRGTITYSDLAGKFGGTARGWGDPLGGIALRLHDKGLPMLSVLVVARETGMPSIDAMLYEDLGLVTEDDVRAEQSRCHDFDWTTTPLWH
jgi:hypothetical protein